MGRAGPRGKVILDRPEESSVRTPGHKLNFQIRTRVVVFQFEASSVFEISIRKTCKS